MYKFGFETLRWKFVGESIESGEKFFQAFTRETGILIAASTWVRWATFQKPQISHAGATLFRALYVDFPSKASSVIHPLGATLSRALYVDSPSKARFLIHPFGT
jgi:hypothetical protein